MLRCLAEQVVNAVMDAEADQLCGGGANSRNGYRERGLATCVGTLTLRIPKLRTGSFFPDDVIERHRRVDRVLVAGVAEMYTTGTNTRKVQRVAEKMGVSRLDAMARRRLRQVPPRWPRRLHRGGQGHRLRCGRLEARPGRRRGGHRVIRHVARLPQ